MINALPRSNHRRLLAVAKDFEGGDGVWHTFDGDEEMVVMEAGEDIAADGDLGQRCRHRGRQSDGGER